MTFADSTIRRIIFPYPEDADYEDPDRPPHWLANIRYQAQGLEGHRSQSSRHRPSRSADYYEALWTSFAGSDDESSGEGPDGLVDPASTTVPSGLKPGAVTKPQPSQPPARQSGPSRPTLAQQSRAKTFQAQVSQRDQPSKDINPERPTTSDAVGKMETRRHHRQHSLPIPLTPAQPLVQVNTFLPLRIPPPDLRAKSPLAYPVGFYFADQPKGEEVAPEQTKAKSRRRVHRRERTAPSTSTRTSVNSLLDGRGRASSSSSSSSDGRASVVSVESDGSFHGDAGDENPESQLAAGIAKLKREQQLQARKAAMAARKAEQHSAEKKTPTINEVDDDLVTAREIEEHAGLMTSLADLVLGLKVTRSGEAFRHRSASYTDVQDLRDQASLAIRTGNAHLSRTQSADALEDSWFNAKRSNPTATSSSSLFSSGVSTPYELRDEVVRWSRRRRDAAVRGTRYTTTSPPSYASTLLDYIPFASALKHRLTQLQSITSIAEVSDDDALAGVSQDDDDNLVDHQHVATLARAASEHLHREQDEGDDETPSLTTTQDDAFSSLWASPITSRASSHYNLKILTDEPSAFEEHSTESSVGPWRNHPSSLRFTSLNASATDRKPRNTSHGVSPLWDENHIDDEDESPQDELTSSRPAYTRSWSSVLGMAA